MAFRDYSTTPASNTELGDGTYIGPNMLRNKVRPGFQQLAADGRELWDEMNAIVLNPAVANYTQPGTNAVAREIGDVLDERPSIKGFFAVPDANYNNAFTKAIAALNAGQILGFHLPEGAYRHTIALPVITANGVRITGDGKRNSLIKPQGNVDCLTFRSLTPLAAGGNGRIADLNISGFGIDYGEVVAPTGGVALTLDRIDRSTIDVEINSAYQGMLVRGGANSRINGRVITSAFSWAAVAVGSYLAKFSFYPGTTEHASEFTIGDVNWKGSDSKLERAVIIECCDGLFFSTGHIGFASLNQVYVNAQGTAGLSIRNINFGAIYFDGNNDGDAAGVAIEFAGANSPNVVEGIDLQCATLRNYPGMGFKSTLTQMRDLKINNCQFSNIGKQHISLTGAQDFSISGNSFRDGAGFGGGAVNAVQLTSCVAGTVGGNRFMAGIVTHPVALNITSSTDLKLTSNQFSGHTTDMVWGNDSARITYGNNSRVGSIVSVVAVDGFTLPLGYDEVKVTGNTNFSNISLPAIEGIRFELHFSGTPTITDGAGNIKLAGNFVSTNGSTLGLRYDGTSLTERYRAIV